jgi:hypothetical protein
MLKLYLKNLSNDIKSTWQSWKIIQYDIGTLYLQWQVLRMLSKKYPLGEIYEPLDELSQRRYDNQMKRVQEKILNSKFEEDDWNY